MPKTSQPNNEHKNDGGFKKGKAPVESPKFFVYNHGYINLAVVLVILTLFIIPPTRHFVHKLVIPQYRETIVFPGENHDHKLYRNGIDDLSTIFFYTLIWYVIHYTVQDKVVAPIQNRLKISEERQAKFTESFLLYLFGLYSIFHEIYIFCKIGVFDDLSLLYKGYPDTHRYLPLTVKMFFILQIAYWLHKIPELIFQNLTKEERISRASYTFYRLGMALYFIELISQLMFHKSRLMYYAGYKTFSTFV
uniref:TRAM1-like protein domain-containing protein n=1 Tax=Panagrolaimus davidi TaxID=227884 RepID=A0A914Q4W7_9BILA